MKASVTITNPTSIRDLKSKIAFQLGIDPFYVDRTEVTKCVFSRTHLLICVRETMFHKGNGWDKVEERLALFNEQLTGELQWFHGRKPQL